MRKFLVIVGILLSLPFPVSAQTAKGGAGSSASSTSSAGSSTRNTAAVCQEAINQWLFAENRRYRDYMFGIKPASEYPVGYVRVTYPNGIPWIKRKENEWVDYKGNTATDDEIDKHGENDNGKNVRKGIFETKRVQTSTLIPYLIQNIRALSCNIDRICEQARISMGLPDETAVPIAAVQPLGCIKFTDLESFPECQVHEGEILDQASILTYCSEVGNQLLEREMALLKLAVEYDAGYRSALQFAGVFDTFLGELRWTLTGSIRQAASLIGQLNRIPCFLSSCDESPTK